MGSWELGDRKQQVQLEGRVGVKRRRKGLSGWGTHFGWVATEGMDQVTPGARPKGLTKHLGTQSSLGSSRCKGTGVNRDACRALGPPGAFLQQPVSQSRLQGGVELRLWREFSQGAKWGGGEGQAAGDVLFEDLGLGSEGREGCPAGDPVHGEVGAERDPEAGLQEERPARPDPFPSVGPRVHHWDQ